MKKIITAASLAGFVAMPGSALGQAATSDVVGYYTQTLNPGFNILGVALHSAPVATGTFESDLTDTDGPDFTTVLTDTNATYLLEVETGPQAGAVAEITAQTATTLTVDGGLPTGGADYTIRPALTLNEIFPAGSLTGGTSAAGGADIVFIPNGIGGFDQFFFSTLGNEFRSTTAAFISPPRPISVFYPDALFIQIVGSTSTDAIIAGDLKVAGTALAANTGFNLVASPGPVGTTLGNSNLSDSLTSGTSAAAADIVFLPNGDGTFTQYFFSNLGNNWRLSTSAFIGNENDTPLPSGFFIQRQNASTVAVAAVPDFFAGL